MAWHGRDRRTEQAIECSAAPSFFPLKTWIKLLPKTIGNRKWDCAWGFARGINTTWENLYVVKHKSGRCSFRSPDWFVLCDQQIFSGGVYRPSATSSTISFSISNSFWYWLYYPGQKKRTIWEIDQAKTLFWSLILHDLAWCAHRQCCGAMRRLALTALVPCSSSGALELDLSVGATCATVCLQAKVWKWRLRHEQACWQGHFGLHVFAFVVVLKKNLPVWKKRPEVELRGKSKPSSSECGHHLQRDTQSCDQPSTRRTVRPLLDPTGPTLLREPGEDRRSWRCRLAERCYPSSSPKCSR